MIIIEALYGYAFVLAVAIVIFKLVTLKRISQYIEKFLDTSESLLRRLNSPKIYTVLSVIVLVWASTSDIYYLGGDDSRLFYLYPDAYLRNFATNIASNIAVSEISAFLPPLTIAPFVAMLSGIKHIFPFINLQSFFYTLNVLVGYYTFYLLVTKLDLKIRKYPVLIKSTVSFLYVTSIFNVYSLFNSKLLSIYLLSLFPVVLLLFIKSVYKKRKVYLLIIAILTTLFSVQTVGLPWFLAGLLIAIPFMYALLHKYYKEVIKNALILACFLLLINLFWIVLIPNTTIISSGIDQSISSLAYRQENINGILATANINSVFFPFLHLYHYQIQKNFSWPFYDIFSTWHIKLLWLNIIFPFVILLAGVLLKSKKRIAELYIGSSMSLIVALYLYTVGIRGFGVNLFIYLTEKVPGFVMFRNMYDKFSFPLGFIFAVSLFISLSIVSRKINVKYFKSLLFVVIVAMMINSLPFIAGSFRNVHIWTMADKRDGIQQLDKDYLELIEYVTTMDTDARYLQLPLAVGNISQIYDQNDTSRIYNGVSPFLLLSGKNDLSGVSSFEKYASDLKDALIAKRYIEVAYILKRFGVSYVIVQNDIDESLSSSYIYSDGLFELQNEEFYNLLLGEKIKDFGDSYTLYSIKPEYQGNKIMLTNDLNMFFDQNQNVVYQKVNNTTYKLSLPIANDQSYLVLTEQYSPAWKLTINDRLVGPADQLAFGYAMGWSLDKLPQEKPSDITIEYSVLDGLKKAPGTDDLVINQAIKLIQDRRIESKFVKENPYVHVKPGTIKYRLITSYYEPFQIATKQKSSLFFLDKRLAEMEKWVSDSLPWEELINNYFVHMENAMKEIGMDVNPTYQSDMVNKVVQRLLNHEDLVARAIENSTLNSDEKNRLINTVETLYSKYRYQSALNNTSENVYFLPKNIGKKIDLFAFTPDISQDTITLRYADQVVSMEKIDTNLFTTKNIELSQDMQTISVDTINTSLYILNSE